MKKFLAYITFFAVLFNIFSVNIGNAINDAQLETLKSMVQKAGYDYYEVEFILNSEIYSYNIRSNNVQNYYYFNDLGEEITFPKTINIGKLQFTDKNGEIVENIDFSIENFDNYEIIDKNIYLTFNTEEEFRDYFFDYRKYLGININGQIISFKFNFSSRDSNNNDRIQTPFENKKISLDLREQATTTISGYRTNTYLDADLTTKARYYINSDYSNDFYFINNKLFDKKDKYLIRTLSNVYSRYSINGSTTHSFNFEIFNYPQEIDNIGELKMEDNKVYLVFKDENVSIEDLENLENKQIIFKGTNNDTEIYIPLDIRTYKNSIDFSKFQYNIGDIIYENEFSIFGKLDGKIFKKDFNIYKEILEERTYYFLKNENIYTRYKIDFTDSEDEEICLSIDYNYSGDYIITDCNNNYDVSIKREKIYGKKQFLISYAGWGDGDFSGSSNSSWGFNFGYGRIGNYYILPEFTTIIENCIDENYTDAYLDETGRSVIIGNPSLPGQQKVYLYKVADYNFNDDEITIQTNDKPFMMFDDLIIASDNIDNLNIKNNLIFRDDGIYIITDEKDKINLENISNYDKENKTLTLKYGSGELEENEKINYYLDQGYKIGIIWNDNEWIYELIAYLGDDIDNPVESIYLDIYAEYDWNTDDYYIFGIRISDFYNLTFEEKKELISNYYTLYSETIDLNIKKCNALPELAELKVMYIDENYNEIDSTITETKEIGSDYFTTAKDIPTYELLRVEGDASGKIKAGENLVKYIYKKLNPTCNSLVASKTSGIETLTSTLTCSGENNSSYKIEVKDSLGNIVSSGVNSTLDVNLTNIGKYTASCYVDDATTTPNSCEVDLTVNKKPGGSTPNFPSCQIDSTTTSGVGSIDTKLTCNGTNTDDYKIEIVDKDGNILENVSGNSLNLKLNNPGEYSAVCHVKNSTATNSCKVPLIITKEPDIPDTPETPEIPVCEALTVTADKGIEILDSRLTCHSKNAKNFKIEVKNELGIVVAGSNSNILDLNLDGIGVYEAVCYTDYYTSQNCKHILTVEEDDFEFNAPKELPKTGIGLYERVKNQVIRFLRR